MCVCVLWCTCCGGDIAVCVTTSTIFACISGDTTSADWHRGAPMSFGSASTTLVHLRVLYAVELGIDFGEATGGFFARISLDVCRFL